VRYLLDRGVLSHEDVLTGVTVDDVSMSHRAFRVRVGDNDGGFFVKCVDPVGSQGRDLSIETKIYRLASTLEPLARVVPVCHYVDEQGGVVVLETVRGDTLASALVPAPAPDERTSSLLAAYGEAVASVHGIRPRPLGEPPWLLAALEPVWGEYAWLPRPCAAVLLRLAANPELRRGFRRTRERWRPTALVHGDLRWANALVDGERVRLIDWELACLGDPAWDVGGMLADLVVLLALGRPAGGGFEELTAWSTPLLGAYTRSLALPDEHRLPFVDLAVRMAAIRLVQSLIEIGHVDAQQMAAAEPVLVAWTSELLAGRGGLAPALVDAAEAGR
jgi:aminoglycoside phosphotransferase (APT) family kinase protein